MTKDFHFHCDLAKAWMEWKTWRLRNILFIYFHIHWAVEMKTVNFKTCDRQICDFIIELENVPLTWTRLTAVQRPAAIRSPISSLGTSNLIELVVVTVVPSLLVSTTFFSVSKWIYLVGLVKINDKKKTQNWINLFCSGVIFDKKCESKHLLNFWHLYQLYNDMHGFPLHGFYISGWKYT